MKRNKIDYLRLLAIFIVIFGIFYFYANIFAPRLIPKIFRVGTLRHPTTILILGTDITFDAATGRPLPGSEGRTDSILLLRIDPVRYKANILSIPRDSLVSIPGYGWQKINAANVYGGIPLLKETLVGLTGKKIDYFIEINSQAVVKLVDLLGGINIYVEKDMYYVDQAQNLKINLKQGWHKLSGREAEGYLRFRHDAWGDIGRIERQQKFLQTLFQTFARPANLLKAPVALQTAAEYLKTDLPFSKTIRLLNFTRMLSPRDLQTFSGSGEVGFAESVGSIWQLNKSALKEVIKNYF